MLDMIISLFVRNMATVKSNIRQAAFRYGSVENARICFKCDSLLNSSSVAVLFVRTIINQDALH